MRIVFNVTILVTAAGVLSSSALAAPPDLVSPQGLAEQRCPTFSWSAVPGAAGYELVVYEVAEEVEKEPLLSARLPAGAAAWTPGTPCLTAGGQYAWTVRVVGEEGEESWSEPALFEVAAPTLGTPSLTVDANVALGAASNLFKDGAVFLWDDTSGNTALGRRALASATGTAIRNTAVGRDALRYTVADVDPNHGW